jgi:hypothetical protein
MRRRGLAVVFAALASALLAGPGGAAPKPKKRASAEAAEGATPESAAVVKLSAEFSGYGDTDAVYVASPTVSAAVADEVAGWSIGGRYLVDAVTAASVDIVSSASSKWSEIRHVGSGSASAKSGSLGFSISGGVSREPDYLSIGGGGSISVELLEKNFTPFVGGSYTHDVSGRTGTPRVYWGTMRKWAGQTGATFVVGKSTIAAFTLDAMFERGYLAKPYRFIPLFSPGVSVPAGTSVADVNRMRLDMRPADALPDARDRFAATARFAHRFEGGTLRLDQRLYRDSWGALASTTDGRYTLDVGSRLMLWPHLRFHGQQAVAFWERAYTASPGPDGTLGVPRYRTGDRELGPLYTATAGLGLRWRLSAAAHAPWVLFVQGDGIFTRYLDALYITSRRGVFFATGLEVEIE